MTLLPSPRPKAGALLLCLALAACASKPPAPLIVNIPPPPPVELEPAPPMPPDDITPLLNYAQSLRRMSAAELSKELSSLNQLPHGPKATLQTAMVLMQTRGSADLARAQALLDSVASSADAPDAPYKPLAQLLSASCAEARRQAEHIDRLALQLKDNQRRTDQLNDMLEALKTIERTLPARPATSAQAGTK
jgi:hypothetical protein